MQAPLNSAPSTRINPLKQAVLTALLSLSIGVPALAASPANSATPGGADTQQVLQHNETGLKELAEADKELAKVDAGHLEIRRVIDRVNQLTAQIRANNLSIAGLQKLNPKNTLANLDKATATAKGDGQSPWFAGDQAPVPSLGMVQKNIADIQQQIQSLQSHRTELENQRKDLITQADKLARDSEAQTGKQSVDTFTQSADLRRKAADLSAQQDDTDSKIMLAQQDLLVAQAQEKQLQGAIGRLAEAVKQTNGGWDSVQKQVQAFTQLSQAVLGNPSAAASPATQPSIIEPLPTTIADGINQINTLATEVATHKENAVKHLNAAISAFNQSATLSQKITREYSGYLSTRAQAAEAPAWNLMMAIFNVAQPTLDKGQAELRLAQLYAGEASTLTLRSAMMKDLIQALADANLSLPSVSGDEQKKLEGDKNQAVTDARGAFESADKDLESASGGGGMARSDSGTKDSAKIAHIIELYAQASLLQSIGEKDGHDKAMEQAKGLVNDLQSPDVVLPSELMPPKQPAAGAPTTAPSEGGAAPATQPAEGAAAPATQPAPRQ